MLATSACCTIQSETVVDEQQETAKDERRQRTTIGTSDTGWYRIKRTVYV